MTIFRLIPALWTQGLKVKEGIFTPEELTRYNSLGYNIYYLPNAPSDYNPKAGRPISGADINVFEYVFCDCDLKDGVYSSKEAFLEVLGAVGITPTKVIDSGNGIHVYWRVNNLDAQSFMRFQRRLCRLFQTDDTVYTLYQLLRYPGYYNVKDQNNYKSCEIIFESESEYTAEQLDSLLPAITVKDEQDCVDHYNKTFNINQDQTDISDVLPAKFGQLVRDNHEAKELFAGLVDDRSKADYRLGHLMFANGFTRDEALSVLINSAKALDRAPIHRRNYALNIVDKIGTFELAPKDDKPTLSSCVADILVKKASTLEGERFSCYKYIDNTDAGFRLGHVMGLVAGSGVGKTAMALNLFLGFVASNPNYEHFFCPLEQTDREIALRWKTMCGDNVGLHNKVHILSNYDDNGTFRDLSLEDIKNYILEFKKTTGKAVGCVVIDHIGILCNNNKLGQDEGVKQIAKAMKSFAIETNTFLIMQSQTSREKAGIGDLELNKDAAFGTSVFENFCDYLVTLWQPLKRVYSLGAPTVMAYKFCKIRHKKQGVDTILEDVPYALFFDPETQLLRALTEDEEKSFKYYLSQATNQRKNDRKTELVAYTSVKWSNDASVQKMQ